MTSEIYASPLSWSVESPTVSFSKVLPMGFEPMPLIINLWYYWYRGGLVEKVEELVEVVLEVVVRWWWCWW